MLAAAEADVQGILTSATATGARLCVLLVCIYVIVRNVPLIHSRYNRLQHVLIIHLAYYICPSGTAEQSARMQ